MRLSALALIALLGAGPALAENGPSIAFIAPTPPTLDNSDRIANTQWVNNFIANGLPLASGKIWIGSAGNVAAAQTPSGDCTLSVSGVITCTQSAGNFTVTGSLSVGGSIIDGSGILATNIAAPATPAAGTTRIYVDSSTKILTFKNDAGTVGNAVVPLTAVAHQFVTGISAAGVASAAQPAFSDLSGQGTCAQEPALTGNVTSSAGSCATTIGANQVARAMEAQGVARSVIGVTGNAAANVADIQGAANQVLVVNPGGTALAFGQVNLAASAAVTGVLPIANGGTNDTGTAWTAYTPTVTAQAGTPGSLTATGRFKTIGKTVFVQVSIAITSAGTATGLLFATLPATAVTGPIQVISGTESAVTGKLCKSFIASGAATVALSFYDNTTVWSASNVVTAEGVYESN